MLKIKDNVSYQKLIGLGFRKDKFNDCYDYEPDRSVTISIYCNNKQVTITYASGYEVIEYDEFENITIEDLTYWMPKMADLVEKV